MKKFIVGKNYRYSEIPQEDTEKITVSEYGIDGIDCLGQNAIHIREHKTTTDVWFIYDKHVIEAIFKCVYNA